MNFYKKDNKIQGFYQLRGHMEDDQLHYLYRIAPLFSKIYNIKINLRVCFIIKRQK